MSPSLHRFKNSKRLQLSQRRILSLALPRKFSCPGMQRISSRSDIDHGMSCKESIGVYDSPAHLRFLLNSFSTWFTLSSLAAQRGTQQCRITWDSVRNLEPQSHPRAASSQSVFYQDPQVTLKHSRVGELQVLAQNFWIPSSLFSPRAFLAGCL